jgi:hypothetical protein
VRTDDEELVESDDKVNDMLLIPSRRPRVPTFGRPNNCGSLGSQNLLLGVKSLYSIW